MIEKLRKLIRESIHAIFEAEPTTHFAQRIRDRVQPIVHMNPDFKKEIDYKLEKLYKVDFKKIAKRTNATRFGILISNLNVPQRIEQNTIYDEVDKRYYYLFHDRQGTPSIGNQLWAIADGYNNTLPTLILIKQSQSQDVNYFKRTIKVDMIVKDLDKLLS